MGGRGGGCGGGVVVVVGGCCLIGVLSWMMMCSRMVKKAFRGRKRWWCGFRESRLRRIGSPALMSRMGR